MKHLPEADPEVWTDRHFIKSLYVIILPVFNCVCVRERDLKIVQIFTRPISVCRGQYIYLCCKLKGYL